MTFTNSVRKTADDAAVGDYDCDDVVSDDLGRAAATGGRGREGFVGFTDSLELPAITRLGCCCCCCC